MSLPSGYKRLEYIQSTGTQYINSKFKANQDTRVVIDFEYISGDVVFGAYDATGANGFGLQAASNKWYTYYGTSSEYSSTEVVANIRLVADVNKNVSTLNGAVLRTATANTFSGANPLIIFGIYNGSAPGFLTALKIYSCQIYDNGTLVRDFIPCKNASGVIGLWDDVNNTFYSNAGSGTFTAGPEVIGSNRVLVDAKGYDANSGTVLVNGMVYHLKKGRGLLNGMGYDIPFDSGTQISELPVGNTVKIAVNGTLRDFLIVHQGLPSSLYDDSCNGTWLLMKDIYENRVWHRSNVNDYANSTIHSYLNSTFLAMFDSNIQNAIKQVKLPYRAGSGDGKTVTSGANGLSAKIFLLSSTEVNLVYRYEPTNEGACLSYFSGTAQNDSDTKRVAYLSGSATNWWLRSPSCNPSYGSTVTLHVSSSGDWDNNYCSYSYGIRPALVLPSDTLVSDDGTITT